MSPAFGLLPFLLGILHSPHLRVSWRGWEAICLQFLGLLKEIRDVTKYQYLSD